MPEPPSSRDPRPRHVSGVGASAGGLEALERLLSSMPTDTGIAFVVVQHLAPDFESMMDELLARKTRLPVERATDGVRLAPDAVYVIPPGKEMIVSSGRLLLADKPADAQVSTLVDLFFRSLARDAGERAIGIVLSGGGTDGAVGVRAIHEAGGLVIAQSPDTSGVDGMPKAAIDTGIADLVLAPEDIPESLVRYGREFSLSAAEPNRRRPTDPTPLETVLALVRERVGVDFSHYKPNTVSRRIHRRLMFHPARRMEDFVARLETHPEELDALYNDLLIGVTSFFRDTEAWTALAEVAVPALLEELESGTELRAWVAGCATGEEAYSLALLLREQLEAHERTDVTVKIFATDVHPEALELASRGLFSAENLEHLTEARRERWFSRQGEIWRVANEIRQMIVFARHDVTSDPPFTRLHLVTCRNLLIYLKPESQRKVISLFHFGLRPGGYLFLGSSETTHGADDGFETADRSNKVYRRRRELRPPGRIEAPFVRSMGDDTFRPDPPARSSVARLLGIYDLLLEQYMPPSLLVDEKLNLLHTFGGAGRVLRVKNGRPSLSVLDMVDPDIRMPLTGALNRCVKERTEVAYTSTRGVSGRDRSRIVVRPVTGRNVEPSYMMVSFEAVSPTPTSHTERDPERKEIELDDVAQEQLESLENELQHTRESLHATIEELETSNEDLQATNEELVASNEELQSTNEELQSVNEELYTVNAELQDKIAQLTELANDMDNLFAATDVGTIFLDQNLCIRKFTPAIAELFHLLARDVGRAIAGFTHRLDDPRILEDLEEVLEHRTRIEREVRDLDGNWLFLRILPYQSEGTADGVVLTVVDISTLKRAEDALFRERYLLRSLMEIVPDPISFKDARGRFVRINSAFATSLGLASPEDAVGKRLVELRPGDEALRTEAKEHRIVATGEAVIDDLEQDDDEDDDDTTGRPRWRLTSTLPLRDEHGQAVGTLGISRDITAQKRAEDEARAAVRRRDRFLATLSHELRNPLAAIWSAAEVAVSQERLPDHLARPLSVIHRQSDHMSRMLEDLLDVARVMQDEIHLRRTPVNLVDIARGCIESAELRIDDHGIRVIPEFPDEAIGVEGDRHRLEQCIDNLLSNAIHHSRSNGRIWIRIEGDDAQTRFTIRDEGVGVPPELLEAIFEPFVQADQSLHRQSAGMGLGLALVKTIVARHGGTVSAHSKGPGTGALFELTLPRCDLDATRADPREVHHLRGLRVVVVEDERDNREMLTAILEHSGCTVHGASDGAEGLETIRRTRPDAALVDLGLPTLDGFEVARRARRDLDDGVLLIAISGYGQPDDRRRAHRHGFDAHLVKPVGVEALLGTLSRLAQGRKIPQHQ